MPAMVQTLRHFHRRRGWPFANLHRARFRCAAAAAVAGGMAWVLPLMWHGFKPRVLAGGAARLAAFLAGSSYQATTKGWSIPGTGVPVLITDACSASDFFVIVTALLAWRIAAGRAWWRAVLAALAFGLPLTLAINALRILAVAQAHRWVIPHFPPSYGAILHLATGVAVFLPALVALNVLLERHASRPRSSLG